jgi:hypothetical protein
MKETLYGVPFYVIIKKSSPETHAIYINTDTLKETTGGNCLFIDEKTAKEKLSILENPSDYEVTKVYLTNMGIMGINKNNGEAFEWEIKN